VKVSILTATTGSDTLLQTLASVAGQDYADIEHMVIIDGPEHGDKVRALLRQSPAHAGRSVLMLPHPTGKNRFNGHRIYGGFSFLASGEFVFYLDEDNFLAPDHVSSLVTLVQRHGLDWAYSLRDVRTPGGAFICNDDCESLGQWPSVLHAEDFMVDGGCYFMRTIAAVKTAPIWYRQARTPGLQSADRALYQALSRLYPRFGCTGAYSFHYRVASTDKSVRGEFFEQGNALMHQRYPDGLPWRGVTLSPDAREQMPLK
jgi:hypothetical protein